MKCRRALTVLLTLTAACITHAINISGVVKNSAGSSLAGVRVKLGKADLVTVTAQDGSFTLKDNTGLIRQPHRSRALGGDCPFRLRGNTLFIGGGERSRAAVNVYDCKGGLVACATVPTPAGGSSITLLPAAAGIHIYRISMGNDNYTFRHALGINAHSLMPSSLISIVPADLAAKAAEQLDDAILCVKEGYQLSRLAVTKSEMSGIQITMIPLDTGTVTDAEGNVYRTVKIGNQIWTAENLRTTKYNDGSSIGSNYHFYNNSTDAAANKKWGALYTWAAVSSGKLTPAGWHVATDADWDILQNYLISNGYNYDGTTRDNKIAKSLAAQTDWEKNSETGAIGNDLSLNNASGFSALPAGYRYYTGEYLHRNSMGYFWTATQADASYAWHRSLWSINFDLYRTNRVKTIECSVRLVKN